MSNYQTINIGKLEDVSNYTFAPEGTPISIPGKVFLGEQLGLTSMEVSINKNPPGTGMSFFHKHKDNEETYIFLGGTGEMLIDGETVEVKEGSVVTIKPQAKRSWWNTGKDDLYYIVIQAASNSLKAGGIQDGELIEGSVPWQ